MRGLFLRPCTAEDRIKCAEQFGEGDYLEWACSRCKQTKTEDASPYTLHLLYLRRLVKAGYPLGQDDLDLETWQDLGMVNDLIEGIQETQRWQGTLKSLGFASRSAPRVSGK